MIEHMWEDYTPICSEINELLSDWQQEFVRGDPVEVRDEVRSFSTRQERIFRLLVLCFRDPEQFWADAEVTLDKDAVEQLSEINEKYESQLGELFQTVYAESTYGHRNTITETTTNIELKNEATDPVIKFEALSGRVPVFELHETPAHFLDLAEAYVSSVDRALDLVEQFEDSDIENIQRQLDRLQMRTAEVAETMNNIETEKRSTDEDQSNSEETAKDGDR